MMLCTFEKETFIENVYSIDAASNLKAFSACHCVFLYGLKSKQLFGAHITFCVPLLLRKVCSLVNVLCFVAPTLVGLCGSRN